jgi:hypothetical protein
MAELVLDTATVAAFQRTGRLAQLKAAAAPAFLLVDVVHRELTRHPNEHCAAIQAAVLDGWLKVEALAGTFAPSVIEVTADGRTFGRKIDAGEAASIVWCEQRSAAVFVSPDLGALFSAFKHLYGEHARVLSFYGFVRRLADAGHLSSPDVRALINYADQKGSMRPLWWNTWLGHLGPSATVPASNP